MQKQIQPHPHCRVYLRVGPRHHIYSFILIRKLYSHLTCTDCYELGPPLSLIFHKPSERLPAYACFPFPAKASSAPRRAVCKDDAEKGPERAWYYQSMMHQVSRGEKKLPRAAAMTSTTVNPGLRSCARPPGQACIFPWVIGEDSQWLTAV